MHGDLLLDELDAMRLQLAWFSACREVLKVNTFTDRVDVVENGKVTLKPEFQARTPEEHHRRAKKLKRMIS